MNAAHLHLMVNHLPVFASFFAAALIVAGLAFAKKPLADAGLVLAIVAAFGALAAVQTGERAEDIVESHPAVAEATIHAHEEAAEAAMLSMVALGVLAFGALVTPLRMGTLKRTATWATLVLALVSFGMVGRAANLGGLIRHPEITGTDRLSSRPVPRGSPLHGSASAYGESCAG
jgi:uncharacterized membrane protein